MLVDGIVQRRGTEKPLLLLAKSLKVRFTVYAVIAALAAAFGFVSLSFSSVVALIFGAAGVKGLIFAIASLLPLATALGFFLAARRTSKKAGETLSEAELVVAKELISSGAAQNPASLTRLMHLPAGRAEEMFGQVEVERLLDTSADIPAQRVRVRNPGEDHEPHEEEAQESPSAAHERTSRR